MRILKVILSGFATCCSVKNSKSSAGIFRYKNQSGIETNPITKDNELIGWQSKFYDTKLSDNKADLIEMIGKSKKAYPD